jgi:hypothetical protein
MKLKNNKIPYLFLLPLIWLNMLFGNQLAYPNLFLFGQIINWLILINIFYLFLKDSGSLRNLKIFSLFLVIIFRLISLGINEFHFIYLIFISIVYILVGNQFFSNFPNLLRSQIIYFVILSIPFMFFQILGISSVFQVFNTLYIREVSPGSFEFPEIKMLPLFLNKGIDLWYSDGYMEFLSMQSRPPGLLHSNAMLSPVVLFASILSFTDLSNRKVSFVDVCIIIAIILTGSKLAFYGYLILLFIATRSFLKISKIKIVSIIFIFFTIFFCYSLVFPDVFIHNHSFGAIQVSLGLRIIDFLQLLGSSTTSELVGSINFLTQANYSLNENIELGGQLSGLAYIFYFGPFIIIGFIFLRSFFYSYYAKIQLLNSRSYLVIYLALFWTFLVIFATPLLGNGFFGIILGIGLSPILNVKFKLTNSVII